jgi:hypothetical protein
VQAVTLGFMVSGDGVYEINYHATGASRAPTHARTAMHPLSLNLWKNVLLLSIDQVMHDAVPVLGSVLVVVLCCALALRAAHAHGSAIVTHPASGSLRGGVGIASRDMQVSTARLYFVNLLHDWIVLVSPYGACAPGCSRSISAHRPRTAVATTSSSAIGRSRSS